MSPVILGACLVLSNCSQSSSDDRAKVTKPANPATERGQHEQGSGSKGAAKQGEPSAPPMARMSEAEARALLDRWLEVQNQGDFTAYESLYAKRFEGVRRSGTKVVRLDRKGWIADRGRMFKRKMEVQVSDLELDVFSQSAILTFTQRWASGTYQDIGPKQLVVAREDGALRIAREEMLASTLLQGQKNTLLADDSLVFIIEVDGVAYAVLDQLGQVPTGTRTLISKGEPVVVTADISPRDVPVTVARWIGQEFGDSECAVSIEKILALSRVVPHFGEREMWNGMDGESEPFTDPQIADAAFHESAAYVVGKLRRERGSCSMQHYTFPVGRTGPVSDQRPIEAALEAAVSQAAQKAFRDLAPYREIQRDFSSYGYKGAWHEHEDGYAKGMQVTISAHPDRQNLQVVVTAHTGRGCGDFEGALTAHFKATGTATEPKLELVYQSQHHTEIVEVLDVDRDGTFEYLTQDYDDDISLVSFAGEALRTVSIGFFDCGC